MNIAFAVISLLSILCVAGAVIMHNLLSEAQEYNAALEKKYNEAKAETYAERTKLASGYANYKKLQDEFDALQTDKEVLSHEIEHSYVKSRISLEKYDKLEDQFDRQVMINTDLENRNQALRDSFTSLLKEHHRACRKIDRLSPPKKKKTKRKSA